MNITVYSKTDYVDILREAIAKNGRGYKSRLAEKAGCQPSYLSQVLAGTAELNPDQAFPLCEFLMLNEAETEFFILLIQRKRAGTKALRDYYDKRLATIAQTQSDLSKRIGQRREIPKELREQYYSVWHHSAVHIATSIPTLGTVDAIASALRLSDSAVSASLKLLESMGLIAFHNKRWQIREVSIHIPNTSPLHVANHVNWRLFFCQDLQKQEATTESLHYSAVHSLSIDDVEKLRMMILDFIEATRKVVEPSPEERLIAFGVDFVPL